MQIKIVRYLKILVAVIGPLLVFAIANKRALTAAALFAQRELLDDFRLVLMFAMMAVALWSVACILALLRESRLAFMVKYPRLAPLCWLVVSLGAAAFGFGYVHLRYYSFAEVYFPQKALRLIRRNDLGEAKRLCEVYSGLYTTKGPKGASPERVCAFVGEFTAALSAVRGYAADQKLEVLKADRLSIPVAWRARENTIKAIQVWFEGGSIVGASPKGPVPNQPPRGATSGAGPTLPDTSGRK